MQVKSKLLSNQTLLFTIGGIIPAVLNFLFLPVYAVFLSPEDFGLFSYTLSFQSILLVLSTLALNSFLLRSYFEKKNIHIRKEIFGSVFIFLSLFNILFIALLFLVLPVILPYINTSVPYKPYFVLMICSLFFEYLFMFPIIIFRVKKMAINFIVFNLARQVLTFSISIALISSFEFGISGRFIGILSSNIIFSFLAIHLIKKYSKLSFRTAIIKEGLSFSFPILIASIIGAVYVAMDKILLVRFISLDELGIYAIAAAIASITNFASLGYYKAVEPIVYSDYDNENFSTSINNILKFQVIGILWISFLVALFSKDIVDLLFNSSFQDSSKYIPIFLITLLLNSHRRIYLTVLHAFKVTKYDMPIILVGLLSYLFCFYIFVPIYGLLGAIYSLALAALMALVCNFWIVYRYIKIKSYSFLLLLSVLLILSISFFQNNLAIHVYILLILKILLSVIATLIFIFYLKRHPELLPT
jgi:O-antigen/teichoic acid export membrane protein